MPEYSIGFRISLSLCVCFGLIFGRAQASDNLNSLQDTLNAALNKTNQAIQNTTANVGSSVTSAANQTANALQSSAQSVGKGANATINATYQAGQSVAASGGDVAAKLINVTGLTSSIGGPIASLVEKTIKNGKRHPLIFYPGFGASRLRVEVEEQELEPDCPGSGSFHVAFGNPTQLEGWPQECIYKLLELQYDPDVADLSSRFSSQPGVNVTIPDFGNKLCAPIPYEPTFLFYEAVGYTVGKDFFVACYDWRVTPFQDVATDGQHLQKAQQLVEEAYSATGLPVYLMGHSNGGLQALALLNSTSAAWKSKYIAGLIGLAGNWAGQGALYASIFSGQSLFDNGWYAKAAPAWETWPGAYMSLADPKVYNSSEVIIRAPVNGEMKNYTTGDSEMLFKDANLTLAQELASQLLGNFSVRTSSPGTHFYGYYGSGQQTLIGVTLPSLEQGSAPDSDGNVYAQGDNNQEETDNLSILEWNRTQDPCFEFALHEEKGISHLEIPLSPSVLINTLDILFKNPKNCSQSANSASQGAAG